MFAKPRSLAVALSVLGMLMCVTWREASAADDLWELPDGVQAVWDLRDAYRQSTDTRERICINGLWQWQPVGENARSVPKTHWGYFKVPGCWPGITDYMQKDCQTVFAHPAWQAQALADVDAAWYQRKINIPKQWSGRRVCLHAEYINSFAEVYIDGAAIGEIRFPEGDLDLTSVCLAGREYTISLRVRAMPLRGVMLSYSDTATARQVQGRVARRGLCGDVYLVGTPRGPQITDVAVATSIRNWNVSFDVALDTLAENRRYLLRARIVDGENMVREFTSEPFGSDQLKQGRLTFTAGWRPEKLWDVHTPQNMYDAQLCLLDADGNVLDAFLPARFGFREFWIDGRDFYLNGTRIFLSSVPLDNAQVGAAWATYDGARESMQRLASFGINFVYTHNYGCEPGSHLGFEEILRAADDAGMLVALSQPHFAHYDWENADAEQGNGYAQHAAFYVRVAGNHPSVVAYATSHNAAGYAADMNPEMIDGIHDQRSKWGQRNATRARRAEAAIRALDSRRIVYHHASGNLGSMHTSNFYANFVPIQEMSDWFEHWATRGVKPLFTCEYSTPMPWDWTMYRGWYQGKREFGSAVVPWEFCVAEWNAQFIGDRAYQISEQEKANLRWESRQFRAGRVWHRWDYPHQVGSRDFPERYPVYAMYISDNWPAFRTWGISANSPWNHGHYWVARDGLDKGRRELAVDWRNLQRPGFSPDYIDQRYERMDLAFERSDWVATPAAEALLRYNRPLLAYIAGEADAFTRKDHNFQPGQLVQKQLILINNSRVTVSAACQWSFDAPGAKGGNCAMAVEPGQQQRIALQAELPVDLRPGTYRLKTRVEFRPAEGTRVGNRLASRPPDHPVAGGDGTIGLPPHPKAGEVQRDAFSLHVLPRPAAAQRSTKLALFDPVGDTTQLLETHGVRFSSVDAQADLSAYDTLIVGRGALTADGPAPDIARVRDGLRVLLFEQSAEVLESRFGFRVASYGLRRVFSRVPNHPIVRELGPDHLRDWRGAATLLPPRVDFPLEPKFNYAPTDQWCGIPVSRLWRCGNRGNVASVLIEKPARGDFLPILDGGYSLQYSPLIEYREGQGMVLFCQLDVTGRTEQDPAAQAIVRNLLDYLSTWKPRPRRRAVYVGAPDGRRYLESIGLAPRFLGSDDLADDDVLILGAGCRSDRADHAGALRAWIASGGHVLALGLEAEEANTFLPVSVETEQEEHIATWFEPFGANSLCAGVAPADIHNAAPRKIPLLRGDAAIGNGVLGELKKHRVVFCQITPYSADSVASSGDAGAFKRTIAEQHNVKRTYRRNSCAITRLLANMGVAGSTPLLERFSLPVGGDEQPARESLGNAPRRSRWLEGLYMEWDVPEEWDDPYRFFRW